MRFNELKKNFLAVNNGKIKEKDVHQHIILTHCTTLEDYNKVFMNLAQRVQNMKLIVIDNIQAIGDNFIKADG